VIVPLNGADRIEIYSESGAHVILDNRRFTPTTMHPSVPPDAFVPMTPQRICDTARASAADPAWRQDGTTRIALRTASRTAGRANASVGNFTATRSIAPG